MQVVFRADASSELGIGHVMRCLTLATELRNHGCHISFVCKILEGDMNEYISRKGFDVHKISTVDNDWEKDAILTKAYLSNQSCDWLVVDHYQLDKHWESDVSSLVKNIMVIDDLANREHVCDLLLDQNFYSDMNTRYKGLLPYYCKTLLGPQHVLFREEFRELARVTRDRSGHISNILIFFGGGDIENLTEKAVRAVVKLGRTIKHVDVVVGASNPYKDQITQLCALSDIIAFHCQTEEMAKLIERADICLGAGGATTWERAILGLPSVTVICADNQIKTTSDLSDEGATLCIGSAEDMSEQLFVDTLMDLMQSPKRVRSLGTKIKRLMGDTRNRIESTATEHMMASVK